MKLERSDVDYPLWRKKVDSSLFNYKGTTIPNWACKMWGIYDHFGECASKKSDRSKIIILFEKEQFSGWVTEAKEKRKSPAYRLWFSEDLLYRLQDVFLMSFMRDIENRLRKNEERNIEDEIPFWEFLDIEYDADKKMFIFRAYYTQKPSFPELFRRLVGSPVLHKIDDELREKAEHKIYKQDWKPRDQYETELGAENVIYMLVDTQHSLFYIGEAQNLIRRFNQGHKNISEWNFYRYNVLPKKLTFYRLELERMLIRNFASILDSSKGGAVIRISEYRLVNDKIDKK